MRRTFLLSLFAVLCVLKGSTAEKFVSFQSGDLDITHPTVYVDGRDEKGVSIAARNLLLDFERATGTAATTACSPSRCSRNG